MKPLKLAVAAWGPYKEEQVIDFEKFGSEGLFLITGPTGSGKTTVFDAITFALFGKCSVSFREDVNFRSDFAAPMEQTYVNLTFSHQNDIYEIKRNPTYDRQKLRGEGETKEERNATISKKDGDDFLIVKAGYDEVNEYIVDLLGVNFEQFKNLCFLPQGEFQRFLVSESKEKSAIFREIFNGNIYKNIQEEIKRQTKDLKDALDKNKSLINSCFDACVNDDEIWKTKMAVKNRNFEILFKLLKDKIGLDKEKEKSLTNKKSEVEKAIEKVAIYVNEINRINGVKNELANAIESLNSLNEKAKEINDLKVSLEAGDKYLRIYPKEELYSKAVKDRAAEEQALVEINGKIAALKAEKEEIENQLKSIHDREQAIEENAAKVKKVSEMLVVIDDIKKMSGDVATIQKEYLNIAAAAKAAKAEYEAKQEATRLAAVGILASALAENEPCPVCGSTHHPNKAKAQDFEYVDEETIDNLKEDADNKKNAEIAKYGELEASKKLLDEKKNDYLSEENKEIRIYIIETLFETMMKKFGDFKEPEEEMSFILENRDELGKTIQNQEKSYTLFINEKEKAQKDNENIQKNYNLFTGKLNEKNDNIKRLIDNEKACKFAFEEALLNDFDSEESYRAAKISQDDANKYKEEIDNYNKQIASLNQSIADKTAEVNKAKSYNEEEIKGKYVELDDQKKSLEVDIKSVHGSIGINETQQNQAKAYYEESQKMEAKYKNISSVNKIMQGNNPKSIKFEDYVLLIYFDEILRVANKRFRIMSEERYTLHRKDDKIDGRKRNSLDLEVLDTYTGKLRPIASISGGEMFKASLSLAFGMSDVIKSYAGGIEVDTLFIDEGFGSLDTESLDTAIDALSTVSADERLIGVISHVEELKNRIDNQIVIDKTKSGSRIKQ